MNNYRISSAVRGFGLAIFAYVLTLGLGAIIGSLFADGDTFTDLGIYALTIVVFAPLGAVTGALVGLKMFGDSSRPPMTWATGLLIAGVLVVMYIGPGMPLGLTGIILSIAAIAVYRTGLSAVEVRELTVSEA